MGQWGRQREAETKREERLTDKSPREMQSVRHRDRQTDSMRMQPHRGRQIETQRRPGRWQLEWGGWPVRDKGDPHGALSTKWEALPHHSGASCCLPEALRAAPLHHSNKPSLT